MLLAQKEHFGREPTTGNETVWEAPVANRHQGQRKQCRECEDYACVA